MVSRRRGALTTTTLVLAAGLVACSSSHDTSGPNSVAGPQPFAPSRDTTLTGTVQFTTFSVPAGVVVTATGALTINASGSAQIAGTLVAPCFSLSLLGAKNVVITGTVSTSCPVLPAVHPTLLILADSGYTLQGAHLIASGPLTITTDTTLTDVGFPLNAQVNVSRSQTRSTTSAAQAGGVCNVAAGSVFTADPPSAPDGKAGSPVGGNGQDGDPWALSCSGELDLSGSVTVTGQNGGNGGTGTSTTGATAIGGNGGKGGTLRVRSAGPMVLSGQNSFASGNGGDGGAGTSISTATGTAASATGGVGGDVTGASGSNGPVDVRAKGSITISGSLSIVVGHGGAGGNASATGVNGPAGVAGSAAVANGGNGGSTSPYGLAGSNVSGLASVTVQGGNGGAGGKATASAGTGGAATTPGGAGGAGGPNTATGGSGGKAQVKDQNGNLVGTGGAAGGIEIDAGNGGAGAAGCPNAGGAGGGGGNASGHAGVAGTGATPGAAGSTLLNNTGNGANGGNGVGPGPRGPAGSDGTPAPKTANGTNFTPGLPGGGCPTASRTLQLNNADFANQLWGVVAFSVSGGALTNVTPAGHTYTIDLTGVPDTAHVRIVLASTVGTTKNIYVYDGTAAYFLAMGNPLAIANAFGGIATGTVKVTQTGLTGFENVLVGNSAAQLSATIPTANIPTQVGTQTVVAQATGATGSLPTTGSVAVPTLNDQQDISSLLSQTFTFQNLSITIPGGSTGGPILSYHTYTKTNDQLLPAPNVIDHWNAYDVGFLTKQSAAATTEIMPVTPQANMPSNAMQELTHVMWEDLNHYLARMVYSVAGGALNGSGPDELPFSSLFTQPTVTPESDAGLTFTITGQLNSPYIYGEFSHSVTVSGTTYAIHAYNNIGSNSFSWTTPFLSGYSAPSGAGGGWQFETGSNDSFSAPSGGDGRFRAGVMGYVGTPPVQTITITAPPSSTIPKGGCTSVTLTVTTTGLTRPTYLNFVQTAGAPGAITVAPAHPVIQPGSAPTSVNTIPTSFCSPAGASGGTALLEIDAVSVGADGLKERTTTVLFVIS
jgi:hypothetical protein